MDKRLLKGEQMKRAILEHAIEIICNEGIMHVSAAKIAASIGTSKSNVFHHFKTREAILIGVHDYIFEAFKQSFAPVESDFKTFLSTLGDALFVPTEETKIYKAFFAFYNEGLFTTLFQDRLSTSTATMIQLIEDQLTCFCDRAQLTDPHTKERIKVVSHGILAFMDGLGLHHMLSPNQDALHQVWEVQITLWEPYLFNG